MARDRNLPSDFWTWEAVIDCKPMTRLLFLGLWNFADDLGVQPLKPRTIRLQVFPGDALDADAVRAMIDELAALGLVRLYSVDGQDYVAVVDWGQIQRVGKRARRRYPADPAACPQTIANHDNAEAGDAAVDTIANHCMVRATGSPSSALRAPSPRLRGEKERWREAIGACMRETWPHGLPLESMTPSETERWIGQWIAEGCDLEHDVLPAVTRRHTEMPRLGPPGGLYDFAEAVQGNRAIRLAARAAA